MKIAIGADHRGMELKTKLIDFLKSQGHTPLDLGTHSKEPCDYPLIGYNVAVSVSKKRAERGILICQSGIGMSIIANKVPGVRAALCHTKEAARFSREHNNANVIVIPAGFAKDDPQDMLKPWLSAEIKEERHKRRVKSIKELEEKILRGDL